MTAERQVVVDHIRGQSHGVDTTESHLLPLFFLPLLIPTHPYHVQSLSGRALTMITVVCKRSYRYCLPFPAVSPELHLLASPECSIVMAVSHLPELFC